MTGNTALLPLGRILSDEIFYGDRLALTCCGRGSLAGRNPVSLWIRASDRRELILLPSTRSARVRGANYNAVAMGTATLLQAIMVHGKTAELPALTITDRPGSVYCGTMLDVARQWHPIPSLRPRHRDVVGSTRYAICICT